MALFIGIDSGTQSTKAIVLDLDRRAVVAEARAPHELIGGLPAGHMEQHPRDWAVALDRVVRDVAARIDRSRVRGIGVSGQQHGFVPLDAGGEIIRPAKLWCDTSTVAECALLTRKLGGPAAVLRETGLLFLPGYTAPKILWLKRHEPANFRRLRHVLLPHDYLNYHLTGAMSMEYGDASGTALLDVRKRKWSARAVGAIDRHLPEWLPPLADSHSAAGLLKPELSQRFGFRGDVLVSAGGGDNMMGAIGTGNVGSGVVTASFGTSGTIYACAKQPVVDPSGEIAAFCSSTGDWLPLLCTMNVTTVTERVRSMFNLDRSAFEAAVGAVAPGAGGLVMLPYLAGERTPNLPEATGVLSGLNLENFGAAAIARAAMEGVTLGMNQGLRRLAALGVKAKEIRVTGGGARSAVWRRIMADVFGVPVVAMTTDEGAALGAAIQAAWCTACHTRKRRAKITEFTDGVVAVDEATRCRPDRSTVACYREVQQRYDRWSETVRPLFARPRRGRT